MNLFKKVLIVGLATMALGSAAMGNQDNGVGPSEPKCNTISEVTVPPPPPTAESTPPAKPFKSKSADPNAPESI